MHAPHALGHPSSMYVALLMHSPRSAHSWHLASVSLQEEEAEAVRWEPSSYLSPSAGAAAAEASSAASSSSSSSTAAAEHSAVPSAATSHSRLRCEPCAASARTASAEISAAAQGGAGPRTRSAAATAATAAIDDGRRGSIGGAVGMRGMCLSLRTAGGRCGFRFSGFWLLGLA